MLSWEGRVRRPHRLQIYPRPELLQHLVAPLDTQLATGDLVARGARTGSSLRTRASSSQATGCARSTGARAPAAAS